MVSVSAIGPISGSASHPAVMAGWPVIRTPSWASIWICLVACFLGRAAAALDFRALNPAEQAQLEFLLTNSITSFK